MRRTSPPKSVIWRRDSCSRRVASRRIGRTPRQRELSVKFIAIALLFCSSLGAWHRNGHMLVAWIAYQHLSPAARSRVGAALQTHPDYQKWIADLPGDGDRGVEAFLQASGWPETIKNESRCY